jgi:hypothetical protein
MSLPNFESMMPQGDLNKALFVSNVLREIFGIQSPVYIANAWFDVPGIMPVYGDVKLLPADESEVKSVFGMPVFGDISFEGGIYNVYNKYSGAVEKAKYGGYTLPYSCIADFSRQNNVITTPVLGSNGTVKEIYGIGDWDITIRGIAFNHDRVGNTAHEQIRQLVAWADICDGIEVGGSVFLSKNISRMVVKSIDIRPLEAKWNVIPFTVQAVSDEPIELAI